MTRVLVRSWRCVAPTLLVIVMLGSSNARAISMTSGDNRSRPVASATLRAVAETCAGHIADRSGAAPSLRSASVDVIQFGARGNGTADDTSSIQSAIDSGAAEVSFPPGIYRVTAPIVLRPNVSVRGSGRYSVIIRSDIARDDTAVLVHVKAIDRGVTLTGFTIEARRSAYGIELGAGNDSFSHNNITDLRVVGGPIAGMLMTHAISNNFFGVAVEGSSGDGVLIRPSVRAAVNDNHFFGCYFSNNGRGGVFSDGTRVVPVGQMFQGCTFEGNGTLVANGYGVRLVRTVGTKVSNSWFESVRAEQRYGVDIDTDPAVLDRTSATIIGNTFRKMGSSALRVRSASHIVFAFNHLGSGPDDRRGPNIDVDASALRVLVLGNGGVLAEDKP